MPQANVPGQPERTDAETADFKHMLKNANLLYLGSRVLLLLDLSYMSRFWTQFEAWLAFRQYKHGKLVNAPKGKSNARYDIALLYGTPEATKQMLIEMWGDCPIDRAKARLASPDVQVTNRGDKTVQLAKLDELEHAQGGKGASAWKPRGPWGARKRDGPAGNANGGVEGVDADVELDAEPTVERA